MVQSSMDRQFQISDHQCIVRAMSVRCLVLSLAIFAVAAPTARTQRLWTIQELFQRNVGTPNQQNTPFPPHKIIGNVYYVGTESLSSFLVTTPEGHILINS